MYVSVFYLISSFLKVYPHPGYLLIIPAYPTFEYFESLIFHPGSVSHASTNSQTLT